MSGTEDNTVEVELESSAPEVEIQQEAPAEPSAPEVEAGGDDELNQYSRGVQARIRKLTERMRKEERDKAEAVRLAQHALEENKKLQDRLKVLDRGYVAEYGSRLNTQLEAVRARYRDAHDRGDADQIIAAQEDLARLTTEIERYKVAKARVERDVAAQQQAPQQAYVQQQAPQQAYVQQPQAQQPAEQPAPDPKAQAWASKQPWFFKDAVMTTAAFTISNQLINDEGFDPSADEYYTELDRRIRAEFPQKFSSQQRTGGGVQVAPGNSSASRNPKVGRRSVRLSPSQVAIATKLGVPLEEYAKYVKD